MPASGVKRVRVYLADREWKVTRVRGVGTRAICGCGFRGPSRRTYAEARKDLRLHRLEHNG